MKISRVVSRVFLLAALCIGGTAAAQDRRAALVLGPQAALRSGSACHRTWRCRPQLLPRFWFEISDVDVC